MADFLIIYIEEAHATDGWAFRNNIDVKHHKSLSDRLTAACLLLKENPACTVVVDTMDNHSSARYAALPERLYVLHGGNVLYKGGIGPWYYKPEEVRDVLQHLQETNGGDREMPNKCL